MIWERAFGALRESRFSVRPSGQQRSCRHSLKDDSNRTTIVKCNPFCSRPSVRLAVALALQPLVANCSSFPISGICGMQRTMVALLGTLPGDHEQTTMAHNLASLPMRLGGLGLRSPRRLAPAAYWASWADAMPMLPEATTIVTRELAGIPRGCFGELHPTWEVVRRCASSTT